MKAVMVAYGWTIGGREGARRALDAFWQRIGNASAAGWLQSSWFDRMMRDDSLRFSPVFVVFEFITRLFSPYEFNPLDVNPLRDILSSIVDFEVLRTAECPVKLSLSATNVRSGKIRVFGRREVSVDHVMASACLPLISRRSRSKASTTGMAGTWAILRYFP
jgi:NTE family protein